MIPPTRNIGAGSTTLSTTDNILNIDTTLGASTVTLPSITEWFILKNKSGSIYDTDGLRFADTGGDSATNNITFLPSLTDQINGSSSMVINTNGASGVLTPTLDGSGSGINSWEFSLTGSSGGGSGAGLYDVFGTVLIDNIFVESLDLVGLQKIYAPNNGSDSGNAINIGGDGTIIETINMPDLEQVYGNIILFTNSLLTSFSAQSLTLVTGIIYIAENPSLASIDLTALTTIRISDSGIYIADNAITSLNLSALTTVAENSQILITNNSLLTTITLNASLNCAYLTFSANALTQGNVDAILAIIDAGGLTRVFMTYDTLVGTFEVGETITGGTSGATAAITSDSGSIIIGNSVLGTFVDSESITGGASGATAAIVSVTPSLLNLTGGTNSAPSSAGLVSKANLIAKGWNVTTN